MDKRQIKTRMAIFESFYILVTQGDFEKVTVQDILNKAGISRSTFYAHFRSKEDLLDAFLKNIFDHVFAIELEREGSHDFSHDSSNYHIVLLHTIYHLKDAQKEINGLLNSSTEEVFFKYLDTYVREIAVNHILAEVPRKNYKISDELLIEHIIQSFNTIVKWWFREGLRTEPEDICDIFESLIIPVV